MIAIRALDGTAVDVDENAVTLVSGPYPHDVGPSPRSRAPLPTERQGPGDVNAVVILGDLATAERVLNARGAHV